MRLLALAGAFGLCVGSIASANPLPDPWDGFEAGPKRAAIVIAECLERVRGTPDAHPESCKSAAFRVCEEEHGTSQSDLTGCARFLRTAWEARLAAVRALLLSARPHPRMGEDPEPNKRMLKASDELWDRWNQADCEMQLLGHGGSMRPMEEHICFGDHATQRALELEALVFWWEKSFELPAR